MGRTTSGQYWERLDHLRAIAAFMVFTWHFVHTDNVVPASAPSLLPLLEEGHMGVSLFMVLSGYLFAKIVHDQRIDFPRFVQARLLRLGPMLLIALLAAYLGQPKHWFEIPLGLVWPVWKNGCWSVAVELQFYVLLPVLLHAFRRTPLTALAVVAIAMSGRAALWAAHGDLHFFAFHSLLGRIDQFVFGILAWRLVRGRAIAAPVFALGFGAFLAALYGFDLSGGENGLSDAPVWIWWPTLEAMGFALLIAWYDGGTWSLPKPFAFVGKVSYSLYLLHFLFVSGLGRLAHRLLGEPNVYSMLLLAFPAFVLMLPIAWAAWRFVEMPAMRSRRPYLFAADSMVADAPGARTLDWST